MARRAFALALVALVLVAAVAGQGAAPAAEQCPLEPETSPLDFTAVSSACGGQGPRGSAGSGRPEGSRKSVLCETGHAWRKHPRNMH